MIADHLSRMEKPTEEEKGTEIEENFSDEQLFQVLVQTPWYADIVNFLACGLMPPEFSYQQIRLLEDVYLRQNKLELWINVIYHHMEDTLQEIE